MLHHVGIDNVGQAQLSVQIVGFAIEHWSTTANLQMVGMTCHGCLNVCLSKTPGSVRAHERLREHGQKHSEKLPWRCK